MDGRQSAVATALRDPCHVWRSGRFRDRLLYYRPRILPRPYEQEYLLVVVRYIRGQGFGRIITAFKTPRIIRGDTLIWSRPNPRA